MTLASCAPEGQPPHFKIAVPEQRHAAATGLGSPGLSGSWFSPGSLRRPSHLARLVPRSTPSCSRVSIKLSGTARSRRQGQETLRQRQRTNEPVAPAQPSIHALRAATHTQSSRTLKEQGAEGLSVSLSRRPRYRTPYPTLSRLLRTHLAWPGPSGPVTWRSGRLGVREREEMSHFLGGFPKCAT